MSSPLKTESATADDPPPRVLVSDIIVRQEFGNVSLMSLSRWDADEKLGFPKAIFIRGRKFRWRDEIEKFKTGLIEAEPQTRPPHLRPPSRAARKAAAFVSG